MRTIGSRIGCEPSSGTPVENRSTSSSIQLPRVPQCGGYPLLFWVRELKTSMLPSAHAVSLR
jgi:hypothetical protein